MDRTSRLAQRRAAVESSLGPECAVVLIGAGHPLPIPGTDRSHPFRAHPEFRYFAGRDRPREVLAFFPGEGWMLFAPRPTREEAIWEGARDEEGRPLEELESLLAAHPGPVATLGWHCGGLAADARLSARLSAAVSARRRIKDAEELACIRRACAATAAGFEAARAHLRPGVAERLLKVEVEAAFGRQGAKSTAFDTIVAGGPNGAILHVAPGRRPLRAGEMVTIDAGAEWDGYASDVTRTYAVSGRLTGFQRDLYELVLESQIAAIGRCRAGEEFKAIHLAACTDLARGLKELGILRGDPEGLVESDAHTLFFPHGLGHLMGLAVHDAGGYAEGRRRSGRFGLKSLRADLPLAPNMVLTIEPGLYFIPALLRDPERRSRFGDQVAWEKVDARLGFGGIRIEDDILVTGEKAEVLTAAIPKSVDS